MITSKQIKETDHYNSLDNVQQALIVKKSQLDKINLGVNMSRLRGIEFWVEKTQPRYHVKSIVGEIMTDNK
jgi:hypothetical protein